MFFTRFAPFTLVVLFVFLFALANGQAFINGDLNGVVATSSAPTNWAQVAFTDPLSLATMTLSATSDVTSLTGPAAFAGINGNPYSGTTFVSGLHASNGADIWHEGIQQNLTGLIPGSSYTISFYQTVVKQSNCDDVSGSWMVAMDNTVVGTTAPTTSFQIYNSNSLVWERRTVTFSATANSHMIKFLPFDDDPTTSCAVGQGGLRMGIDSITLSAPVVLSPNRIQLDLAEVDNSVVIGWESYSLDDFETFTVQRSPDGIHFEDLETYAGDIPYRYSHTDPTPYSESWYRLAQKNPDGDIVYSEISSIQLNGEFDLFCFGNTLKLVGHEPVPHRLFITDLQGKEIYSGEIRDELTLDFLNSGVYVVYAMSPGPQQKRVVKKVSLRSR